MNAQAASVGEVWAWLGEVADPEIPVISVVDLGIVRDVAFEGGACVVTITPTYSGCPAMQVIAESVTEALHAHGISNVRLVNQLSCAWTTDWMSEAKQGRAQGLRHRAMPAQQVIDISGLHAGVKRTPVLALVVACPNCGSRHTQLTSQFGSTPCKALYKCLDCREPFDYFKCH
ncbi:phenylacetate-CoA oxygenase subunit PaaJ [Massilia sp. B-10]|nr:phenylacetate-CoA oxygenase subunit PaaJ [Massilia sp. B-10]